jgi:hypothetical protein
MTRGGLSVGVRGNDTREEKTSGSRLRALAYPLSLFLHLNQKSVGRHSHCDCLVLKDGVSSACSAPHSEFIFKTPLGTDATY